MTPFFGQMSRYRISHYHFPCELTTAEGAKLKIKSQDLYLCAMRMCKFP